jgi:hypothetical protein
MALTAIVFWPVVWHLRTRILGDRGDASLYLWNMWAIPRSLLHLENPFSTDLIFHPMGAQTAFNTNMPLIAVVTWPVQMVFGLAAASNLAQLAAVVLTGFGAYLLAARVSGNRAAGFVAGAAFTFIPYRFAHVAQFSLGHLEFLPFGLLALLRLIDRPTFGRAAVYGTLVGFAFLTDLYYTVFLLLGSAVVAAWHWRRLLTREVALRLAQAGGVALMVGLPLFLSMLREIRAGNLDRLTNWANADNYNSDLLSWVVPSDHQRLWSGRVAHINAMTTGGERLAFPGYVVLALALAGAVWGWRRRRGLWVTLAASFFVLSLGPFLRIDGDAGDRFVTYGVRYDWPLPYFVFHYLPVVQGIRVPGRFSVMAILGLVVLAALALARLAEVRPRLALAAPAVALVLVMVEFWPTRIQMFPAKVPAPYTAIARSPGHRAVLEIPLQWRTGFGAFGDQTADQTVFMYYATRHRKPMVGGMVARFPDARLAAIQAIPVYREILKLQSGKSEGTAFFTAADLDAEGIGYVVVHRDRARAEAVQFFSGLGLPTLADDGTVLVLEVPAQPPGAGSGGSSR